MTLEQFSAILFLKSLQLTSNKSSQRLYAQVLDSKIKNKIITAVRKINRNSWGPRKAVKNRAKVNKSLFQCEKCECYVYEGTSAVNYFNYIDLYPKKVVKMEKLELDHISPVIEPDKGWQSWDSFMDRLFCPEDNWQALCHDCHKEKTSQETKVRWKHKYGNKK